MRRTNRDGHRSSSWDSRRGGLPFGKLLRRLLCRPHPRLAALRFLRQRVRTRTALLRRNLHVGHVEHLALWRLQRHLPRGRLVLRWRLPLPGRRDVLRRRMRGSGVGPGSLRGLHERVRGHGGVRPRHLLGHVLGRSGELLRRLRGPLRRCEALRWVWTRLSAERNLRRRCMLMLARADAMRGRVRRCHFGPGSLRTVREPMSSRAGVQWGGLRVRVRSGGSPLRRGLRQARDGPEQLRVVWSQLSVGGIVSGRRVRLPLRIDALRGRVRGRHDRREALRCVRSAVCAWAGVHAGSVWLRGVS